MKPILTAIAVSGLFGLWSLGLAEEPSLTTSDEMFVATATTSGSMELELGHMAAQRAEHADLKAFAQRIIVDHAAANIELLALAGRKRIPVPKKLDTKQQEALTRLSKLNGVEFYRAYATQMVKDYQKAVELFRDESERGKDADLKAYATKILPVLEVHLRLARELAGDEGSESKSAGGGPRQ